MNSHLLLLLITLSISQLSNALSWSSLPWNKKTVVIYNLADPVVRVDCRDGPDSLGERYLPYGTEKGYEIKFTDVLPNLYFFGDTIYQCNAKIRGVEKRKTQWNAYDDSVQGYFDCIKEPCIWKIKRDGLYYAKSPGAQEKRVITFADIP
ncbi:hypothetical protein Tsubulata_017598 [Turnera subulata]|uniref:S-protein homolog n=1 Tax=Turnera subulata TaxID=218843 RepID=A0A9Q0F1F2_9ROSI|nr:hypothetical protein Tsubulata_017598 [Turnera subulata]